MLFHSQQFLIFFALVFAVHWSLPSERARRLLLLGASFAFYMVWSVPLVSLLILSTVVDFYAGRLVWETGHRRWLYLSLSTNLAVLGFFKYANFFVASIADASRWLGLETSSPALAIVLPLGISFYTFQSMSYTLDLYRRKYSPYDSIVDFGLYISFFPQLIAGPIVRADHFRRQLDKPRTLNWTAANQGLSLFIIGVFKKVALADQAAVFANSVFAAPQSYTSVLAVVGVLAFSFQIYFDFSGYTDMARGLGYVLGYRLPENFLHPYGALGIRDFWRRWHLSLSSWLRDYLYISLGGSRLGAWKTKRNLMLTMLLGGLWHGAAWNFVIWGGIHGLLLGAENALTRKRTLSSSSALLNGLTAFLTFLVVTFAWIFFRAQTFPEAMTLIASIGNLPISSPFHQLALFKPQNWALGILLPFLVITWGAISPPDKTLRRYPLYVAAGAVALMLLIVMIVAGGTNEFIYFQF